MVFNRVVCVLAVFMSAAPLGAVAQERSGVRHMDLWRPSLIPLPGAAGLAAQERRLPVYDGAGELIPFAAIEAAVDPSGLKGAFWGGLGGALFGSALGNGFAPTDCDRVSGRLRYHCSPRQEALNNTLPGALAVLLGALGAWIGSEQDRTSWNEALYRIRLERRGGVR